MKNTILMLALTLIFFAGCKKDKDSEIEDEQQNLYESNLAFINSDWNFESTGDSINDQFIGLWLSNEVSYDDSICYECDSLFTWVIESTGTMTKRNNSWGDHETLYGNWEIDKNKELIFFNYKDYPTGGTHDNYRIITDTITIEYLNTSQLWTSHFIDYPPTTKMDIKFDKIK